MRQSIIHTLILTLKLLPVKLMWIFLVYGRKPEYTETTLTCIGKTSKLPIERLEPGSYRKPLLLWDNSFNHCPKSTQSTFWYVPVRGWKWLNLFLIFHWSTIRQCILYFYHCTCEYIYMWISCLADEASSSFPLNLLCQSGYLTMWPFIHRLIFFPTSGFIQKTFYKWIFPRFYSFFLHYSDLNK